MLHGSQAKVSTGPVRDPPCPRPTLSVPRARPGPTPDRESSGTGAPSCLQAVGAPMAGLSAHLSQKNLRVVGGNRLQLGAVGDVVVHKGGVVNDKHAELNPCVKE